ncbi:MAG: hypothetical protein ACRDKY_03105 [Solirubrobacteraceae bacterium]
MAALLATSLVLISASSAAADPAPSGAIFTTLADGSEVNFNIYPNKEAVYLDGGPGPGAPQTAAGLDDGTYVFQVTDPSGKTLLSTDLASCRQFTVSGGIITSVAPSGACAHVTGIDLDYGATTVQLMPYNDTPNPGGVYKVWVTLVSDYLAGCSALGVIDGLSVVDCGYKAGVSVHGFIPSESKTDNFKVKASGAQEIDTQFYDYPSDVGLHGLAATWTDPTGAKNKKWSYHAPSLNVFHEAHVEAVTAGTHYITVADQPGCTVGSVRVGNTFVGHGPRKVPIKVNNTQKDFTIWVIVECI